MQRPETFPIDLQTVWGTGMGVKVSPTESGTRFDDAEMLFGDPNARVSATGAEAREDVIVMCAPGNQVRTVDPVAAWGGRAGKQGRRE